MKTLYIVAAAALLLSPLLVKAEEHGPPMPSVVKHFDPEVCAKHFCDYWKSMPKLEYAFFAAEAADMLTTLDIKNHPDLIETNIILGKHPSDAKIIALCASAAMLHSVITYELMHSNMPRGFVKAWEITTISIESGYAVHNLRLGLRFRF